MQLPADYPPVVYVPIAAATATAEDAQLEYRATKDGRKALLAYSALDRLRAGMGDAQPWLVMPTLQLQGIWEVDKFDTVLLDIEIPPEHRNGPEGQAARAALATAGNGEGEAGAERVIGFDHSTATAGVKAIRDAAADFDDEAASKNPTGLDAGAAQGLLADVLATTSDIALRLVYELDTLAANADAGLEDLAAYDANARSGIQGLTKAIK